LINGSKMPFAFVAPNGTKPARCWKTPICRWVSLLERYSGRVGSSSWNVSTLHCHASTACVRFHVSIITVDQIAITME
jgi:hypothetical protein